MHELYKLNVLRGMRTKYNLDNDKLPVTLFIVEGIRRFDGGIVTMKVTIVKKLATWCVESTHSENGWSI